MTTTITDLEERLRELCDVVGKLVHEFRTMDIMVHDLQLRFKDLEDEEYTYTHVPGE